MELKGMLLTTFLEKNYGWAQEPHLYIVEQIPQIINPSAHRCGAAGTYLYKDSDEPFKASDNSQRGLQGRLTQYNNYFLMSHFELQLLKHQHDHQQIANLLYFLLFHKLVFFVMLKLLKLYLVLIFLGIAKGQNYYCN